MAGAVGGVLRITFDNVVMMAHGHFRINLGGRQNKTVKGPDAVHGPSDEARTAYCDGAIVVDSTVDPDAINNAKNVLVQLKTNDGEYSWPNAWNVADAEQNTEEGQLNVRFEAKRGFRVAA